MTGKDVTSVKVSFGTPVKDLEDAFNKGGVFSASETLKMQGKGAFSGRSLEIRISIGDHDKLKGFDNLVEFIRTGITYTGEDEHDEIVSKQLDYINRGIWIYNKLYEANGKNVTADSVSAEIRTLIRNNPLPDDPNSPKILRLMKQLQADAAAWDDILYEVRNKAGDWETTTALKVETLSETWSVKGGTKGYVALSGYIETLQSAGSKKISLDYVAHVSVSEISTVSTIKGNEKNNVISTTQTVTGQKKAGDFADVIYGYGGDDTLSGGGGNDKLYGGAGNDKISGDAGRDYLTGNSGKDTFIFKSVKDSTVASTGRDTIYDFKGSEGDRIDLRSIDANTRLSNDQEFKFIGQDKFHMKAGELRYEKKASDTLIYGDVNGDGKADFAIHLDDAMTFSKGHFLL